MARTASLSGFPEWLPEERLVELHVLDTLRRDLRAARLLLNRDPRCGNGRPAAA